MYQIGYRSKLVTTRHPRIIINTADIYEQIDKVLITKSFNLSSPFSYVFLIKRVFYLVLIMYFYLLITNSYPNHLKM